MSNISAGYLNERISIVIPTYSGRDDYNGQLCTTTETSRWAHVSFNKGSRAINVGEAWMQLQCTFTIRYTDIVNERCHIKWDGKEFQIDSVNRDKEGGRVVIVASKIDNAEQSVEN